ncbi:hypothetical protein ILYODFUR_001401 [Ilyodon furcidens]|uniref:Uncharacterized protein n=1 Tax=Ilyodon furcidens TaxID=33524 RepID=A0ABV0T617_9TELE
MRTWTITVKSTSSFQHWTLDKSHSESQSATNKKNASEFSNFKQRAVHGWEIKTTSLVFSESYSWNLFHAFILTSATYQISVTQFILFGAAHYVKSPLSSQLQMTLGRNI